MRKLVKLIEMENVENAELPAPQEPYTLEHLDSLRNEVFSNELIFEKFLKILTIADLKAFRHVCRNWHQRANKIFYEKACIQFRPWQQQVDERYETIGVCPKRFTEDFYHHDDDDMDESCEGSSNTLEKLKFQRCTLYSWDWSDGLNTGEHTFWDAFGSQIKYLRLHKCMLGFGKFNHLISMLRGDLTPHLETLVLENSDFHVYCDFQMPIMNAVNFSLKKLDITGPTPFPDWSFLKMFPNLGDLKLAKMSSSENLLDQLSTLRSGLRPPKILSISKLDIMDTYQSLAQFPVDLPLKELSFRISRSVDKQQLLNIFENYSKSLEKLRIFRTPHCEDTPFPNFEMRHISFSQLKTLELWGNFVFNFNFLKCTPALKRFQIDVQCYDKRDIIDYYYSRSWNARKYCKKNCSTIPKSIIVTDAGCFALEGMRELVMDVKLGVDDWKELKLWLPGLTKIMAPLDNLTLQVVCANWEELDDLKLRFPSDVDDGAVTGYSNIENMRDGKTASPNVTDLKNLKSFETEVRCGTAKLTDFSATMGFLEMPSLQTLRIYASDKMSQEVVGKLQERIGTVRVLRNYWVGTDSPKDRQECCNWTRHQHRFFTCHCEHCQPYEPYAAYSLSVAASRSRRAVLLRRPIVHYLGGGLGRNPE